MKQVLIKKGMAVVEDVPAPSSADGFLLVAVKASCISIGTEMSGLAATSTPLWKRALAQPEKVMKVVQTAKEHGVLNTVQAVQNKLDTGAPTGYSAAGIVLEAGEGCEPFRPGDRVACAGAQYANHAEVIRVPKNLCVRIPDEASFEEASTVTLGAIALQGVRRLEPTLGEKFVVMGLGVLGQITVQLLKANGCKVVGIDLDRARVHTALEYGMDASLDAQEPAPQEQIMRLFGGYGADGVIITAATASNEVISSAFHMCRKKGRVVLVGDVGLNLRREDFYKKELDFRISTSYGPGRYDGEYEEKGLDYPIGYVRWTENRNMQSYLEQLAAGSVRVSSLITKKYPVEQASAAYDALKGGEKPLVVVLTYGETEKATKRVVRNPKAQPTNREKLRVAIVGAGGFARGMHLPNLRSMADRYEIRAIVSNTGSNAQAVAKEFQAAYASTDYEEVLKDRDVDVVLISTRHNTHAAMTLEALRAGKHVFVEKPLALNVAELAEIERYLESKSASPLPVLMTGFNRRFSPAMVMARELMSTRTAASIIDYRMNAGFIPSEHWVHQAEGGGRNIGEACHIYDLFTFLTNETVTGVRATSIRPGNGHYGSQDNFVATVTFSDGSVATLTYTSMGHKDFPKETAEIFVDGKVVSMSNFEKTRVIGLPGKQIESKLPEKGLKQELERFAECVRKGGDWPIPLWQQLQAMRIAFEVESQLRDAGGSSQCAASPAR